MNEDKMSEICLQMGVLNREHWPAKNAYTLK